MEQVDIFQKSEDEIIKHYMPLVKQVAYVFISKLPSSVSYDDIYQDGMIGLLNAIRNIKYLNNKQINYKSYLITRIRGNIIDSLRDMDWMSRSDRNNTKKIQKIIQNYLNEFCKPPSSTELFALSGMTRKVFDRVYYNTLTASLFYIDDLIKHNSDGDDAIDDGQFYLSYFSIMNDPSIIFEEKEKQLLLQKLIDRLPTSRTKNIIHLLYNKNFTLSQIADVFAVTESRICQLHKESIKMMRNDYEVSFA